MAFPPDALMAPLRLAINATLLEQIYGEPLLFAAHFAAVTTAMHWPEAVEAARAKVQERYQKHDEVLVLMEKLGSQVPISLSADLAIRLAEGLEVRYVMSINDYRQQCQDQLHRLIDLDRHAFPAQVTPGGRLGQLAELLDFSPAESTVFSFALAHAVVPELQLLAALFLDRPIVRRLFWQTLLDLSAGDLAQALSVKGPLAGSGLLTFEQSIPTVTDFWARVMLATDGDIETALVEPLADKESPGGAARLPIEDRQVLLSLLRQSGRGINILLYGKASVDKMSLGHQLIGDAGKCPYALVADIPEKERPAALMLAQRLLARRTDSAVLVVPTTHAILSRTFPDNWMFFGFDEDRNDFKPRDQRILSDNPLPTVWITHDPGHLHPETLARILFHGEALKGGRVDRQALVDSLIAELPLAEQHKAELIKLEGLSAQQLLSARTLADLTANGLPNAYGHHLLLAATRSQKALARRNKDEARLPVTTYRLDYLNAAGRFGPAQILQAMQHRPQGSLCLYGLPGTGKTQFAEYLALELGKPILIKRASDIFDKFLGESEKRISEMFEQAEEEDALLLLDEADSFLRDRSRSRHGWEVTTVNELLQRMERFDGVFVCTTNLYAQIDAAALRRFTFKLEFLPLNADQRWQMFLNETGLRDQVLDSLCQAAYEEQLVLMRNLTAGDFATVQRQCRLLGETLTPEQWLEQLEIEVRAKNRPEQNESDLPQAA